MTRLLGPVEELANTLTALLTFLLIKKIEESNSSPLPFWLDFSVGALIAVGVAGLVSTWVWRRPVVEIRWSRANVAFDGSILTTTSDSPLNRSWRIEIGRHTSSLVGLLALLRMRKHKWVLNIEVEPGSAFFITSDYCTGESFYSIHPSGLNVGLTSLHGSGPSVTMETEWQARGQPQRVECSVKHRLRTGAGATTWMSRLVKIDANVSSILLLKGN